MRQSGVHFCATANELLAFELERVKALGGARMMWEFQRIRCHEAEQLLNLTGTPPGLVALTTRRPLLIYGHPSPFACFDSLARSWQPNYSTV